MLVYFILCLCASACLDVVLKQSSTFVFSLLSSICFLSTGIACKNHVFVTVAIISYKKNRFCVLSNFGLIFSARRALQIGTQVVEFWEPLLEQGYNIDAFGKIFYGFDSSNTKFSKQFFILFFGLFRFSGFKVNGIGVFSSLTNFF